MPTSRTMRRRRRSRRRPPRGRSVVATGSGTVATSRSPRIRLTEKHYINAEPMHGTRFFRMAGAKWKLDGDWINSCNCDSGCPCLFYSDPTRGFCEALDAFHIRKGKYGDVTLDGR